MARPKAALAVIIEEMLIRKYAIKEICDKTGSKPATVVRIRHSLKKAGIELLSEPRGWKEPETKKNIDAMLFCRTFTDSYICEKLGVTSDEIRKRRKFLRNAGHDIPLPLPKMRKIKVDYDVVQHSGQVGKNRFILYPCERRGDYVSARMSFIS